MKSDVKFTPGPMRVQKEVPQEFSNMESWGDTYSIITTRERETEEEFVGFTLKKEDADLFAIASTLKFERDELLELVRSAFDRFTDNDMQPPNHALSVWLKKAESILCDCREKKTQKMHPTEVVLEQCPECGANAIHPTMRHCMKCKYSPNQKARGAK